MLLNSVFKESIKLNLTSKTKEAVFSELVEEIACVHPELNPDEMLAVIWDREKKMNTQVTSGVAVPHGYYPGPPAERKARRFPSGMVDVVGAMGISKSGIDYGTPAERKARRFPSGTADHDPVHFVFLLVMSEKFREKHLQVLSRTLSLIQSGMLSQIQAAGDRQEVSDILARFN
jgi:mannitol/fructose-specific phosphotransferase system IIA component (Ntr-type)